MIGDPKCKICRRAGEKLFLKGDRCYTPKCAFERKPYPPGKQNNERKHRSMLSEYGVKLREKQKVRNIYRLSESQFEKYVRDASTKKGANPAHRLYESLERRLDSVIFRMGLVTSRSWARQLVTHGHATINGRRVDIPSYKVKKGDIVAVRDGSKGLLYFENSEDKLKKHKAPSWILFNPGKLEATIKDMPSVEQEDASYNLTSIIEYYSR